jgi:Arc/MetJ family transcription regulator
MATNLAIDEKLLADALKAGALKTKKATVNEALREFIQRRKQTEILKLFGSIDFDQNYDHKKGRTKKGRTRR